MHKRLRSLAASVAVACAIVALDASSVLAGGVVAVSGLSPFSSTCGIAGQSGRLYINAEVEPRVAADPTNPKHLVGAWQQDRWSNGGARGLLAGVSFDGGASWARVVIPGLSLCSGGSFERVSDPWVSFAPNGDVYAASLPFNDTSAPNGVLVSKSTDGGLTWGAPITIILDTDFTLFDDKEAVTADPNDSNFAYVVWDRLQIPGTPRTVEKAFGERGPAYFSRTTDGGNTWSKPAVLFDPGVANQTIGNQIVVTPSGTLVNITDHISPSSFIATLRDLNVVVLRSTNRGLTWSGPIFVSKLGTVGVRDPDTGEAVRTEDIIPDISVDRTSGALYAVWQDARFSGGDHDGIAFSKSIDDGVTWSAPVQINKATNVAAFTPTVHVAAEGTIGVLHYDFRNNTPDPSTLPTDVWLLRSTDGGATWTETHVAGPFDMKTAPVARGFFVGDYEGLTAIGRDFVGFFAIANSGNTVNRTDIVAARIRR